MPGLSIDTLVARLRGEVAALRFALACRRVVLALKYSPDQPRVPAGNPDGGQWTDGSGFVRVANSGPGGRGWARGVLARFPDATPGQAARLAATGSLTNQAVAQVRQIDPTWSPLPRLRAPNDIESQIAANEGIAREAIERMHQLRGRGDGDLIQAYRLLHGSDDLFGNPNWPADKGTVAIATFDGRTVVGVNSAAPGYTSQDRAAADRMRATLIRNYPQEMNTEDVGCKPNDARYHAEATSLLRAAKVNEGTLPGKTVNIFADREMCWSCDKVLPYIGLELGNPTVTFRDKFGIAGTMRDGR